MAIEFQELNETFSINLRKRHLKDWVDDIQGYTKDLDCDELDRRFASQAIAFVIKHSRKGVVSLCTAVATLLQEKYKLQLANKRLQKKLLYFKGENDVTASSLSSSCFPSAEESQTPSKCCNKSEEVMLPQTSHPQESLSVDNHEQDIRKVEYEVPSIDTQKSGICNKKTLNDKNVPLNAEKCVVTVAEIHVPPIEKNEKDEEVTSLCEEATEGHGVNREKNDINSQHPSEKTSEHVIVAPSPLVSCLCERCKLASDCSEMYALTCEGKPILQSGDVVLTNNDLIGTVVHVGHVDNSAMDGAIYARLRIDFQADDDDAECEPSYRDVLLNDIRCVSPKSSC